jgi:hypothetical protein
MLSKKKGLHGKQQEMLANAARVALDDNRPGDALSLVERASGFQSKNLITILGVFCTHPTEQVRVWAFTLLRKNLAECSDPTQLVQAAFWLRNPKRSYFLPEELNQLIDGRRKELEPVWDGMWQNPGLNEANVALTILTKRPEEILNIDDCIIAASQARNWYPWLARYRALGGSPENPKYLKLWVKKFASQNRTVPPKVKKQLQRFCEIGLTEEVRAFLRSITPSHKSKKSEGRNLNPELAKYALLIYCGCERLELGVEDWVHIAKSALYLKHSMIQRIAQRGLAVLQRPPSAHQVFEELRVINGDIPITNSAKEDIGLRGNPIWQSVYHLLPVDANARRILVAYSISEAEFS